MAPPDRLRPHPRDRWPDKTQLIDLTAAVTGLRAETHHAIAGHRQIALGRDGPVTLLLFVFESGGFLKEANAYIGKLRSMRRNYGTRTAEMMGVDSDILSRDIAVSSMANNIGR